MLNAMSVDVEDYFQVQALAGVVDRDDWDNIACRVEANTNRLLDMYAAAGVKITFFTLGWVAARYPALIRRMVAEGHEVASHGLAHVRVDSQTPEQFRADIRQTKRIIEDAGGVPVRGYRAATFSINTANPWAFDVLAEEGHVYSSSIYPVKHDFYGVPDAPRFPYRPRDGVDLVEIPMTTVRLGARNLPCSGGGYFRLLPYAASRALLRRVNRVDGQPVVFYMHPWEIDPDQPRVAGLSAKSRFRHYVGLARMQGKLARLLGDFAWGRMDRAFATSLNGG
jgi:polysaccharide deacetylase family protein (PEP-CTERM system associated)